MTRINELLEGKIILEERHSEYNGTLSVVKDLLFGTYIVGGGLPQSGGLAKKIWRMSLGEVKKIKPHTEEALIVGLGGGGIAGVLRKNYPYINITGVDIDSTMVDLGKKYLKLDAHNVDIHIQDAEVFIDSEIKRKHKYDLVCFDTYVGDSFPERFTQAKFVAKIKKILSTDGLAVFNRLYGPEDRAAAHKFFRTLEKVFSRVDAVYPVANVMYIVS
ncbi:methyltransferase domain-containing protein [Candidatus Microgenomates bacterium]|nr:MAG: methyltransferase domain-containing protein [Candidatus Microgenomates bacterium]